MHALAQLTADGVSFSYGPREVVSEVSLTVAPGDCIGLVGPNGCGKSTLLRVLAGELEPAAGSVAVRPTNASVMLMHQQLTGPANATVLDYLHHVTGVGTIADRFHAAVQAVSAEEANAAEEYDHALTAYLTADVAGFEAAAEATMTEVGLATPMLNHRTSDLSGGERTKIALAAMLLSKADVLLLDEPTNDLDHRGLELLEELVGSDQRPTVVVSHDRAFLEAVTTAILELDPNTLISTRYNGGFASWQRERSVARAQHQQAYDDYQAKRSDLRQRARTQQQWSAAGVRRARADKSEGDKFVRAHRIATSEKVAGKAKQTQRALERLERNERVEAPWKPWELQLVFASAGRSGQQVAQLSRATVDHGDFVLGPVTAAVHAGDRILITGANGSGKTTLLRALFGEIGLTSGTQSVGPSTERATLRQSREFFGSDDTVLRGFVAATGLDDQEGRSQLAKLGITANLIDGLAGDLSPGEQTRLAFAAFAARGANVLVFDEPTNHLDLEAIEQLEAAIEVFPHTMLLVTHDRRLIETVTTNRHWHLDAGQLTEH